MGRGERRGGGRESGDRRGKEREEREKGRIGRRREVGEEEGDGEGGREESRSVLEEVPGVLWLGERRGVETGTTRDHLK